MKKKLFLSTVLSLSILLFFTAQASAGHPSDVILKDYNNNLISGTSNPYSPKNSCGLASCHDSYTLSNPAYLDRNTYESSFALATKSHVNKNGEIISYNVPYPQHGVSASYHIQMGRGDSWGDVQREYYNLEEFTSSSGHYGRY